MERNILFALLKKVVRRSLYVAFLMLLLSAVSFAQQQTVTGTVIGEDGLSLPGVTVVQKGTSQGTITDMDGKYTTSVAADGVLVFSFCVYNNCYKKRDTV